jgi:hypothetical protein
MGLTPEETTNMLNGIAASDAIAAAKRQSINDNLPSWSQVETALDNISNLTEAKAALKKIARVVYWLPMNKGD